MDFLGSPNNLNYQDMIPIYQANTRPAITLQLPAVEREPPLRGPQLTPQIEALTSRFQQLMAGTAGQHLQFQNDVIVNVDSQGPVLQVGLPDRTNQQLQFQNDVIVNIDDQHPHPVLQVGLPEYNTGGRVEDPIFRLRLHATYSFTAATTIGVLILPGELHRVHATYERAQLMATVGVPIAVAVFTFLASFRYASDTEGWSNWITVLSRVNTGMIGGGPLVFYFMRNPGTGS